MSVPPPPTIQQAWQKFSALSAQAGSVARSYRSDAQDSSGFYDDFLEHEQQFLQGEPPKFCQLIDRLLPDGGLLKIAQRVNIFEPGNHDHKHLYFLARLGDGNDKTYIFYYYDDETKFTDREDKSNTALHERGITYSALGFHYNQVKTSVAKEIVDRHKTIDFNDYSQLLDLINQHGNEWKPPYIPSYDRDSYDHGMEEMHIDSVFDSNFTRFFENEDHNFKPNGYPLGEGNPRIKAEVTFDGQTVEDFDKLDLLKIGADT